MGLEFLHGQHDRCVETAREERELDRLAFLVADADYAMVMLVLLSLFGLGATLGASGAEELHRGAFLERVVNPLYTV